MNLSNNPLDYLKAFLGGVGISFTPCVYPLIPVIVGYIGIKAGTTKLRGFLLSLTYVTGVAVTYSVLGLIASLTGKIFGVISSHPITYILVGLIVIIFGLSLLDLFNIPIPHLVRLAQMKEKNYLSIFLLGLSSGLIIGPCTAPALGAILVYLATKRNILYGTTLLVCFAYGMGLVLVLAGTFSSVLVNLPKSGKWLIYIKRLAAIILTGIGIYFIFIGIRRILI
jgi:thiol:disulfide interchange protein DsbD